MRAGGVYKDIDNETVMMLEPGIEMNKITQTNDEALSVEIGDGIADCGATRTVIGEETWHRWLKVLRHLGQEDVL